MGLLPLITVPALPQGRACKYTAQTQSIYSAHNRALKSQELPGASDTHHEHHRLLHPSRWQLSPYTTKVNKCQVTGRSQHARQTKALEQIRISPSQPNYLNLATTLVLSITLLESLVYNMHGPTLTIKIHLFLAYQIRCSATVTVKDGHLNDYTLTAFYFG